MVFLSSEQLNLIWSGSLVSWIPDSNLQQDSGFLVLDSGFQSPGFRIPEAKNSWIPESGFPYMGREIPSLPFPINLNLAKCAFGRRLLIQAIIESTPPSSPVPVMGGNKVLSVLLLHYISDPPWLSRGIFPIYKSQKFLAEPVRNSGISPSILLTFTYVILQNSFKFKNNDNNKGRPKHLCISIAYDSF